MRRCAANLPRRTQHARGRDAARHRRLCRRRHPLNLGMMGMHGEAWVNHAIQQADLLLAFGMRFDDRVTGQRQDLCAQGAKRFTSTSTRPRSTRTSRSTWPSSATWARRCKQLHAAARRPCDHGEWAAHIDEMKGDQRRARYSEPARQRPPVRRARHQRSVALPPRASADRVTDVGQHQMWEAQCAPPIGRAPYHLAGLGTMGFGVPAAMGVPSRAGRRSVNHCR